MLKKVSLNYYKEVLLKDKSKEVKIVDESQDYPGEILVEIKDKKRYRVKPKKEKKVEELYIFKALNTETGKVEFYTEGEVEGCLPLCCNESGIVGVYYKDKYINLTEHFKTNKDIKILPD